MDKDREKQTITKEDVGVLDITPDITPVDFKLKKAGKFSNPINENALIICPGCGESWGAKKWARRVRNKSMSCPGCGKVHKSGTEYKVSYMAREFEEDSAPAIPGPLAHVGGGLEVGADDELIKKTN